MVGGAELGPELDKYLAFARSLRDGATFDTAEQVGALALQHLHRFNYNPTDAACALYARHSIELPSSALATAPEPSPSANSKASVTADVKRWLAGFYQSLRRGAINASELRSLKELQAKAQDLGDRVPQTEAGVLSRLLGRIGTWQDKCARFASKRVGRGQLLELLHEAEDMQLELDEKTAISSRLQTFEVAYVNIKDALERSRKRSQVKVPLSEVRWLWRLEQIAFTATHSLCKWLFSLVTM